MDLYNERVEDHSGRARIFLLRGFIETLLSSWTLVGFFLIAFRKKRKVSGVGFRVSVNSGAEPYIRYPAQSVKYQHRFRLSTPLISGKADTMCRFFIYPFILLIITFAV
jgi:hypothetical protein